MIIPNEDCVKVRDALRACYRQFVIEHHYGPVDYSALLTLLAAALLVFGDDPDAIKAEMLADDGKVHTWKE